jgi:hypothetical protein
MGNVDQRRFEQEVMEAAYRIELVDALGGARQAQSFPTGRGESTAVPSEEIERAKAHAEDLIKQPTVIERLCPALKAVSDDLGEVAKIVAAAMIPLALGPQAILPLTPLAFGALAVIVVRVGVRSLCSEDKGEIRE